MKWAGVKIEKSTRIVSSVNIIGSMCLSIGENTFIGHQVLIVGGDSEINIGSNVDIGPRVLIVTGSHIIDMEAKGSAGQGISSDINIESGVWIGANATILGGVTIGQKSVVGAGSTVNQSIPPFVIAVGNPCRPIKQWNSAAEKWETILWR